MALLAGVTPVIVGASAAILLTARSGPFFVQSRVGLNRRAFRVFKLRTMSDGGVTSVGRLLRKTKIDELPQLANIALGDMRFVGPRPITVDDVQRLGWQAESHDARWVVAPGITGPTQLSAICDASLAARRDERFAREATSWDELELIALSLVKPLIGARRIAERVERWT